LNKNPPSPLTVEPTKWKLNYPVRKFMSRDKPLTMRRGETDNAMAVDFSHVRAFEKISAEDLRPGAGSDELTALLVIEPVSPTVWRANDD
jgi:hypothetical protein